MPSLKSSFSSELNQKWCTNLKVVGVNSSILARRSYTSPQGFKVTENKLLQMESKYGSVVLIVVNKSLNGR